MNNALYKRNLSHFDLSRQGVIYLYLSGLLRWDRGSHIFASMPAKHPWRMWVHTIELHESNDKQRQTILPQQNKKVNCIYMSWFILYWIARQILKDKLPNYLFYTRVIHVKHESVKSYKSVLCQAFEAKRSITIPLIAFPNFDLDFKLYCH